MSEPKRTTIRPLDLEDGVGWYEWFKMPANTSHIAYAHEGGDVYDPENGWNPPDFLLAAAEGRVHKLVRVDEPRPFTDPAFLQILFDRHFETEQMLDNAHGILARYLTMLDLDPVRIPTRREVRDLLVEIHDAITPERSHVE